MLNLGNINFDNDNLAVNAVPKITAPASGLQTFSPSGIQIPDSGILLPTTLYSAAGTALPAASTALKGATAIVTDADSPSYGTSYTSGGGVVARVLCNGTDWVTL